MRLITSISAMRLCVSKSSITIISVARVEKRYAVTVRSCTRKRALMPRLLTAYCGFTHTLNTVDPCLHQSELFLLLHTYSKYFPLNHAQIAPALAQTSLDIHAFKNMRITSYVCVRTIGCDNREKRTYSRSANVKL